MHGNILDANSTNKLINQSVKDAVDDKFIESGYVTKDLLEAETSARTKGDEDLSAKIKAEQTRAEGKEKEISDKLAIVDGDFVNISDFATQEDISSLRVGLSKKQNKITVNEVDVTDIETADITKLRTIVTNLINALSASDLISKTIALE